MKGIITTIILGIITILFLTLTSCTSQKRLQRRIERHGIKESVGFVIQKYPEYFKGKDTVIHDTTIIEKVVEVPTIDTTVILSDSSDFYHYKSDSLSLLIDKLTGSVKIKIKQKRIYIHDTVSVAVPCPKIICPDCDDLKDYTAEKTGFKWWWLVASALLGAFLHRMLISRV
jgi:hypothetical protein